METTTIYVPTRITSYEQAEALPVGTIALLPIDRSHRQVLTKTTDRGPGPWELDMHGYGNGSVVGWTALVPVQVEVEHLRETEGRRRAKTLYVTPWQEPAG